MESRAAVIRRWKRTLVAIVCLMAMSIAILFGSVLWQVSAHRRWYHRVELNILRLAESRPETLTEIQWTQCLQNTWNLHCNYGDSSTFPADQREPFVLEFERRLKQPVDIATIDWIWDDYVRRAPRANSYVGYRPTTAEMLGLAEELMCNSDPLDAWIQQLQSREERAR